MKRALSFILALTLAFALFPTFAYASTTEETPYNWEPIVFDFRKPTVSDFGGNNYLNGAETYIGANWTAITYKDWSGLLDGTIGKQQVSVGGSGDAVYIALVTTDEFVEKNKSTFMFGLDVPESGIFNISTGVYNSGSGATAAAVMKNLTKETDIEIGDVENVKENGSAEDNDKGGGPKNRQFSNGVGIPVAETTNWDTAQNSYDIDNQFELTITKNAAYSFFVHYLTFTPSTINSATVTVDTETEYEIGAVITPTVSLNVEGIGNKVYSDLDMAGIVLGVKEDNAGVTVENNVYKATKSGELTFTPTVTVNGQTHEAAPVTITVAAEPEEDEELSGAFDDAVVGSAPTDYIAPSVDVIEATGVVGNIVPVSGGAYKITAAETDNEKGNFLYWKKAMTVNEKIVSFDREFNYVPESEGRNILVAVYEGDVNSTAPKCYNANGQYLRDAQPIDADLPSMAGYGKAYKWEQYGDTNVWVAQYEAETPIADIDVEVKGDNTSGGGTNLAYGASVTCTATGKNFKCWKKAGEIVSCDSIYTFKAWEDCTVEAIYEADVHYTGSKLKIIIDSFTAGDETGVMAEFLGLGNNVVEKGIMFGNNRIAMTTVGNQFSVIADEPGTYKGYVIVEETDGLKLITDGFYEHN
ncbi:MAG: hypothetical protein E7441_07140 [Ruminococcaceae bacterium]|nr:hypothetical protein [Oscillospiraceae bacterium]